MSFIYVQHDLQEEEHYVQVRMSICPEEFKKNRGKMITCVQTVFKNTRLNFKYPENHDSDNIDIYLEISTTGLGSQRDLILYLLKLAKSFQGNTIHLNYKAKSQYTDIQLKYEKVKYPTFFSISVIDTPIMSLIEFKHDHLVEIKTSPHCILPKDEHIKSQISALCHYKTEREAKTTNEYFCGLSIFTRAFGGWSKTEKFEAVDALIDVLQDSSKKLDSKYLGPLLQGDIYSKYIKILGINLDDYVDKAKLIP